MANVTKLRMNDGIEIPQLGFGVFQVPPEETVAPVAAALEAGYRLIDTAQMYGNEEGVGKALAQSGIPRSELFITTKLNNNNHGRDGALRSFDESLTKLGLDHIDLFLIHWPLPMFNDYVETWKALEEIRASGRARSIGVSNFTEHHLNRLAAETNVTPVIDQVELHPEFPQTELRAYNADHEILTESWGPIGQGKGLLENPEIVSLAKEKDRSPAQVVLRWHLQLGLVVIPKSVNADRIRENIEVFDFELSESEMSQVSGLDTGKRLGPDPETFDYRP